MAKNLDSLVGVMLNKTNEKSGLRLSDVFYVKPSELQANPLNKVLFKEESNEYFERMSEDIRERGILVPLIAKNDGTLLAGHNRLHIAQKLNIAKIPVQYLEDKLSEQKEKEFIIKDNIFRRQHSAEEWISLYKTLYPNFEQRLASHGRPTSQHQLKNEADEKADLSAFQEDALTAKKIALDTGQTAAAVQKQLHRAGLSAAAKSKANKADAKAIQRKPSKEINLKAIEKYSRAFGQMLDKTLQNVENEHTATKKELFVALKKSLNDFQRKLLQE